MTIREIQHSDLSQLLELYSFLHSNTIPLQNSEIEGIWNDILNDPNHHIIVGLVNDIIISSCVLIIVPNLTHKQRPYALIENVITHPEHRAKGYATKLLDCAKKKYKAKTLSNVEKDYLESIKLLEQKGKQQN